jgi:hypothetical protein
MVINDINLGYDVGKGMNKKIVIDIRFQKKRMELHIEPRKVSIRIMLLGSSCSNVWNWSIRIDER